MKLYLLIIAMIYAPFVIYRIWAFFFVGESEEVEVIEMQSINSHPDKDYRTIFDNEDDNGTVVWNVENYKKSND